MRQRLASEIIRELEARIARLERQASSNRRESSSRYADPFLAELQADIDNGMFMADELMSARQYDPLDPSKNKDYSKENAIGTTNCYDDSEDRGGQGNPGGGTCYRLHHEYGELTKKYGPKWWLDYDKKKQYNEDYGENYVNNNKHTDRKTCPDGNGGTFDCEEARKSK